MLKLLLQTPPTTDNVLSVFQKTLTALEGVKAYHSAAKEAAEAEAERLQLKALEAHAEVYKATTAIEKLSSLFR